MHFLPVDLREARRRIFGSEPHICEFLGECGRQGLTLVKGVPRGLVWSGVLDQESGKLKQV